MGPEAKQEWQVVGGPGFWDTQKGMNARHQLGYGPENPRVLVFTISRRGEKKKLYGYIQSWHREDYSSRLLKWKLELIPYRIGRISWDINEPAMITGYDFEKRTGSVLLPVFKEESQPSKPQHLLIRQAVIVDEGDDNHPFGLAEVVELRDSSTLVVLFGDKERSVLVPTGFVRLATRSEIFRVISDYNLKEPEQIHCVISSLGDGWTLS